MKKLIVCCAALAAATAALRGQTQTPPARKKAETKLVLAIVVDQFRFDYLTRFRNEYNAGFKSFFDRGAVFTNAYHEHFPTVTAVGHAAFLSGATPSIHGIVGNEWFDRETNKQVSSVADPSVKLLGSDARQASSPHRLQVSTLGDEMKMSGKWATKVIGISIKDRSAILPAGRMGDGAYWFDNNTGNFVSSTWYFPGLPQWVQDYNQARPGDKYAGMEWKALNGGASLGRMPAAGTKLYSSLERSPWGNELIEAFAERAVEAEQLGQRGAVDLLAVSFSSNDYVGHDAGPDSPQVHDISLRTDRQIGKLFQFLDKKIGIENVLVVMTADHGVAPMPEVNQERRMPGGRLPESTVLAAIEQALTARYGPGKWVAGKSGPAPYFNLDLIRQKGLDEEEVHEVAASAVRRVPHIYRVHTREDMLRGNILQDAVGRRMLNGFHVQRASDLFIVAEPYWMFEDKGTSHGTPFVYDTHVPILFMGPGIKPGQYDQTVAVVDIAPTLALLLAIEPPGGAVGRVLTECLEPRKP